MDRVIREYRQRPTGLLKSCHRDGAMLGSVVSGILTRHYNFRATHAIFVVSDDRCLKLEDDPDPSWNSDVVSKLIDKAYGAQRELYGVACDT